MRVLLRNTVSGRYYHPQSLWVTNPEKGFDFGSIQSAMECAGQLGRENLELALAFGNPSLISAISMKTAMEQVAHSRAEF